MASTRGRSLRFVQDATVAACQSTDIYINPATLYIRGEGVKSVTDACKACCANGGAHLDNFTSDTACSGIPSLPTALTIQLF